ADGQHDDAAEVRCHAATLTPIAIFLDCNARGARRSTSTTARSQSRPMNIAAHIKRFLSWCYYVTLVFCGTEQTMKKKQSIWQRYGRDWLISAMWKVRMSF